MAAREQPNHYAILGLRDSATDAEVKAAHRRLIRIFHTDFKNSKWSPEHHAHVEEIAKRLNAAKTELLNGRRRSFNKTNYANMPWWPLLAAHLPKDFVKENEAGRETKQQDTRQKASQQKKSVAVEQLQTLIRTTCKKRPEGPRVWSGDLRTIFETLRNNPSLAKHCIEDIYLMVNVFGSSTAIPLSIIDLILDQAPEAFDKKSFMDFAWNARGTFVNAAACNDAVLAILKKKEDFAGLFADYILINDFMLKSGKLSEIFKYVMTKRSTSVSVKGFAKFLKLLSEERTDSPTLTRGLAIASTLLKNNKPLSAHHVSGDYAFLFAYEHGKKGYIDNYWNALLVNASESTFQQGSFLGFIDSLGALGPLWSEKTRLLVDCAKVAMQKNRKLCLGLSDHILNGLTKGQESFPQHKILRDAMFLNRDEYPSETVFLAFLRASRGPKRTEADCRADCFLAGDILEQAPQLATADVRKEVGFLSRTNDFASRRLRDVVQAIPLVRPQYRAGSTPGGHGPK